VSYAGQLLDGWELAPAHGYLGPVEPVAGVHGVNGTSIGFDDATLGRHVLFLGGIGTGKTVGMTSLVASLRASAQPEDVFVFFDTKGDYLERFYQDGDAVIARSTGGYPGQVTWNLFYELDDVPEGSEISEEIDELAGTLFADLGESSGNNQVWAQMARDVFAGLLLSFHRERDRVNRSNRDIRWVADEWNIERLRTQLSYERDLGGTLQYLTEARTANSVMIFFQRAIRDIFKASFRREGDFSVRRFVRAKGGRALFLEYDVASGETLRPIYRTMIDLALKESLGRSRSAGRVFVILDEFSLLPKLQHMDAGLNFGRSLGLRFVVGTQNVGQVMSAYGSDIGGSILAGFGTTFTFRLYDEPSRTYVRGRFGTNRRIVNYDSSLKTRGVGEHFVEGSVVEDWNITRLGVGQAIAALPDGPPIFFEFVPPTTEKA
jgi:hypothetical protein